MSANNATNPQQYDSPELNWQLLGAEDARKFFRDILDNFIETNALTGKRVIDIGSGVGHLFPWLKAKGALAVTGIDPATKNIATSKEKYPWATSVVATLEEFARQTREQFDVAIVVMAFEHIENLNAAFRDIIGLLTNRGRFYLIVGDKDYHLIIDKEKRNPSTIKAEIIKDLGDGAVEVETIRDLGNGKQSVMYDIFRPMEQVFQAAEAVGFKLLARQTIMSPMPIPTPMLHALAFVK